MVAGLALVASHVLRVLAKAPRASEKAMKRNRHAHALAPPPLDLEGQGPGSFVGEGEKRLGRECWVAPTVSVGV